MRNIFISYHHKNDQDYKDELTGFLKGKYNIRNYALHADIGDRSRSYIFQKISYRLWSCSIVIVLVGKNTAVRKWVDMELYASLKEMRNKKLAKRSFKPKGLLVIYLSGEKYPVPPRLQDNIDSGYAIEMNWDEIENKLEENIELAYLQRNKKHLIRNDRKKPESLFWDFFREF